MADLVAKQGKNIILLYRLLKKAKDEAAWKLAFQTDHSSEKLVTITRHQQKMGQWVP